MQPRFTTQTRPTAYEVELIGPDGQDENLAREDSDVVGNVLFQGYTTRTHYATRIGGDGTGETWGRYRFVNSTVVLGNATTSAVFRPFDGIESVEMHDNAFFRLGGGGVTVFNDSDATWKSGSVVGGSHNWVPTGSTSIPSTWTGTMTGASPGFVDVANLQVHLATGSALVNAGVTAPASPAGHPFPNPLVTPAYEPPLHTVLATPAARTVIGAIDVGAYELAGSGSGSAAPPPSSTSTAAPPPSSTSTAAPPPSSTSTAAPPPSSTSTPPPSSSSPPPTGASVTLLPVADAYVEEYASANTNFGSAAVLFAATNTTQWYDDDTYLKFDVTNVARVSAAKLHVTAALTATSDGALTLAVYPVSDTTWSEAAITWNNRPARGTTALASATVGSDSYVAYDLDVTSYVASAKAAGQTLVSFALHDPNATNARILMPSKEGGAAPSLIVAE